MKEVQTFEEAANDLLQRLFHAMALGMENAAPLLADELRKNSKPVHPGSMTDNYITLANRVSALENKISLMQGRIDTLRAMGPQ